MHGKWLAAFALALAACGGQGDDDSAGSQDAGIPGADASPSSDSTRDVAGMWLWTATRVGEATPFLSCKVAIDQGNFDITCPQGVVPRPAGDGCTQLRDDLHLHGYLGESLAGMLDTVVAYDGAACANYGYTVGAPFPTPAFAQMAADRVKPMALGGFLADLGGGWDWELLDTRTPDAMVDCKVALGVALADPGVKLEIACPLADPAEVIPGCTAQAFFAINGHLVPGALDGDLAEEVHHEGASCGVTFPPVVRTPRASMKARHPQAP